MRCSRVQDLLSAFVDDTLSLVALVRVRRHLRRCEACRATVAELQAAKAMLGVAPVPPAREGFWEEAYRNLESNVHVQRRRAGISWRASLKPVLALLIILLPLILVPVFVMQRQGTDVPVNVEEMVREHAMYSSTRSTTDPARMMLTATDIDEQSPEARQADDVSY